MHNIAYPLYPQELAVTAVVALYAEYYSKNQPIIEKTQGLYMSVCVREFCTYVSVDVSV